MDRPNLPPGGIKALARQLLGKNRRPFVIAVGGALVYLTTQLAVPLLTRTGVDALTTRDGGSLRLALIGFVGVAVVRALAGGLRKYYAGVFSFRVGTDLRAGIYEHLQVLDIGYHGRMGSGQLLSRAAGDVTLVETFAGAIPYFTQSLLVGIAGVPLLVWLDPLLATVVLVATALVGGLVLRAARPMYPTSVMVQNMTGAFTTFVEQQVEGIRVVKGHGFEPAHRRQGRRLAVDVRSVGVHLGRQRARLIACMIAAPGMATLLVLLVGGERALHGQLRPGDIVAFVQYLGLLVTPIVVGAQLLGQWPQVRAAAERVAAVLEAPVTIVDPPAPVALRAGPPELRFEDVWFGYDEDDPVLAGFDLTVPAGSSVALVGMSGSGKTTALRLVERFFDPWQGRVLLDGVPASRVPLEELRARVTMVFEDAQLFSTSVVENVQVGRPGADDELVRRAMTAAAAEFVGDLDQGLETQVGEKGTSLSGGQRQRVALARSLVRHSDVLLLDDVTSALDPQTADRVRASLAELMLSATTLVVAQSVETALLAKRVALVEDGRVKALGTHKQLMRLAAYRKALALTSERPG